MRKILITTLLILAMITTSVGAMTVTYTPLGVPNINSSFKTWMSYRAITNKNSEQYKLGHKWGWTDSQGFRRCSGERDLGILDDYYMVAMGSFYGVEMGTKFRITTDTGNMFYVILSEAKGRSELNPTMQYGAWNRDIIEMLVETRVLNPLVKKMGNADYCPPLNGRVLLIERMNFS